MQRASSMCARRHATTVVLQLCGGTERYYFTAVGTGRYYFIAVGTGRYYMCVGAVLMTIMIMAIVGAAATAMRTRRPSARAWRHFHLWEGSRLLCVFTCNNCYKITESKCSCRAH